MKTSLIAILSSILSIAGYTAADKIEAYFDNTPQTRCFNGVSYIEFPSSIIPNYKLDGTINSCKE